MSQADLHGALRCQCNNFGAEAGRARPLVQPSHTLSLGDWLQPLCVSRDELGVQHLTPGVLERPNGLVMLAEYGFAPATQVTAAQVLAWSQAYMAHPIQHPRLGGAPTAP